MVRLNLTGSDPSDPPPPIGAVSRAASTRERDDARGPRERPTYMPSQRVRGERPTFQSGERGGGTTWSAPPSRGRTGPLCCVAVYHQPPCRRETASDRQPSGGGRPTRVVAAPGHTGPAASRLLSYNGNVTYHRFHTNFQRMGKPSGLCVFSLKLLPVKVCAQGCGVGVARSRSNDAGFIMGVGVGVGVQFVVPLPRLHNSD